MNVITRNIPNTITCINLIAGCVAIVLATHSTTPLGPLTGLQWSYIAIAVAAIADFCDGLAARTLKAYSDMGKELDSLCDMVSFGIAPAMMVYQLMLTSPITSPWAWTAVAIAVCGALRLARFNVDDSQATTFVGIPIPANAIFWIGFTSIFAADPAMLGWLPVVLIILFESWLMVSPWRMFSLKFKHLHWRGNEVRYIIALMAIAFIVCMGTGGLMWLIVAYVLLSRLKIAFPDEKK